MTTQNFDIHSEIKIILKSDDFSDFAKSEEFCFYVANGGYEKVFCGKLAYLLSKKLENKNSDILICLEAGKKRFDIVVSEKNDLSKILHIIEVKHSFSTHYVDAFNDTKTGARLKKDITKLENESQPGTLIYLVSRLKKQPHPRSNTKYKKQTDPSNKNIEEICNKLKSLKFDDCDTTYPQKYQETESSLNIFIWRKPSRVDAPCVPSRIV